METEHISVELILWIFGTKSFCKGYHDFMVSVMTYILDIQFVVLETESQNIESI